jgi:hypothetical protein
VTTQPSETTIWVTSDVTPFGNYQLAIHFDDDTSRVLDRDAAYAYASAILDACERAEYDAAVARQLSRVLKMPEDLVGQVISDLRADRPPLDQAAISPLDLEPGVSAKSGRPFLTIYRSGRPIGQWEMSDARGHATHVLRALEAVPLDAAYRRYLVGQIGIEPERALNVVDDLANHRSLTGITRS